MIPPVGGAVPVTMTAGSMLVAKTEAASLLAEPGAPSAQGFDDALSMLYAINAKLDGLEATMSERQVADGTAAKRQAAIEERAAIAKQEEARRKQEEDSHSFWHELGSAAGVIGKACEIVAVAAVTWACPPAGAAIIALSVGSMACARIKGTAGVLGQIGCIVGEGVAAYMTFGTSALAGAAESAGAVANGTSSIAQGIEQKQVGDDAADAADAEADAKAAQQRIALRQALIEDVIEAMKESHDQHSKAQGTIQQTLQTGEATSVAIASFGRV